MPLSPGAAVGPYEVTGTLGAGGMGEVYRARDTKLGRSVALKVLPDLFASDPERLARFTREAQVLASLNHPNIAAIYGLEGEALVMELVEGDDLSVLIARGPMMLADALAVARQIADAIEAAHEQGIIHRDLKPGNVKVRADGTVKVLDFGLAKALDPNASSATSDTHNSPTLTARATQMGMIIGTAAYMSPEQARGKAVDRRADVWAFGAIVYEMLTGTRAFEGDDVSVTLASVIKDDPRWTALPGDLPPALTRLLRRCLEKDPKRRLSAIGDARLELEESAIPGSEAPAPASRSGVGRLERAIWASGLAVAGIAAALFALQATSIPPAKSDVARFGVLPPGDGRFSGAVPRFSISPDGRLLVFAASPQFGKPDQLWLRRTDTIDVTPVAGSESIAGAQMPQSPFWSPDSEHLAFFVQDAARGSRLKIVNLQSGSTQFVCELPSNNPAGSWNRDGVILVSSQESKGIQRVPAAGGPAVTVTTLDASRQEIAHLWPQFLPDGRHFIYQSQTTDRREWSIFVGSLDSPDRRKLVQAEYARVAAPNLVLFVRDETLFAQVLDAGTMALTGEASVVATGVPSMPSNGRAAFSVSDNGVLVSSANPADGMGASLQLAWVDRTGKVIGSAGPPTSSLGVRLSPDGTRAALLEEAGDRSQTAGRTLWVADLDRGVKAPLTTGRAAVSPSWSADGLRVVFGSRTDRGAFVMAEGAASGATAPRTMHEEAGHNVVPLDESADGKLLVFSRGVPGLRALHVLSRSDGKSSLYLGNEFDYPQASLSHDGKWLAYTSNESGSYEVIVRSFPDPSQGKWPISTRGGSSPRWRRDGRELFYLDAEQRLIAVAVETDRGFVPGRSTSLFFVPFQNLGGAYGYDVVRDGQKFLLSYPPGNTAVDSRVPLTVTTNWTSLLKK